MGLDLKKNKFKIITDQKGSYQIAEPVKIRTRKVKEKEINQFIENLLKARLDSFSYEISKTENSIKAKAKTIFMFSKEIDVASTLR